MKVIGAGTIKTGTKSLNAALKILGYNVYDFLEHFEYFYDDWMKIFEGDGSLEDLKRMYKDVDVGVDMPFLHYWRELLEAFPKAKIILTVREDEKTWYHSYEKHINRVKGSKIFMIFFFFSSLGRKWMRYIDAETRIMFGEKPFSFKNKKNNKMLYLQHYRRHNAYVEKCAPPGQLLIFNCKDGWKPLCGFLNLPIPDVPFPHKNINSSMIDEMVKKHHMFTEMKRQTIINVSILIVLFAVLVYLLIF